MRIRNYVISLVSIAFLTISIIPLTFGEGHVFKSDQIELLELEEEWSDPIPVDISNDGTKMLLFSGYQRLAIMNTEDNSIEELSIPIDFDEYSSIQHAMFDKENNNMVFLILDKDLYKIDFENNESILIIEDVGYFDVNPENKLIFSKPDPNWDSTDLKFSIWMANPDGTNSEKILDKDIDQRAFDLSPDGTKLVFLRYVEKPPLLDQFITIYDFEKKEYFEIPGINVNCGMVPVWSPNSQYIIYVDTACKKLPSAGIHITDFDGNSEQVTTLGVDAYQFRGYIASQDGAYLYYSVFPDGMYKITLAQAVPEFETVVGFVLVGSFIPIILIQKYYRKISFI